MNDPRDDQFWNEMRPEMRRAMHLEPLSDEEAAREFDESPEVPLLAEQIAQYARIAAGAIPREPSYNERTTKLDAEIDKEVGDVVELFRNEGDLDPDVEEEMRRQREDALADDEEEKDDEETDES